MANGLMDAYQIQADLISDMSIEAIFDIGANVGQTTATYSKLFPNATIYGFEPFPLAFDQFVADYKHNPMIHPVQAAVSNSRGNRVFYVNQNSMTNSLFPATDEVKNWVQPVELIRNVSRIEVPCVTIDAFCQLQSINHINILKMDIQGGELLALQGAAETLSRAAITLIYTEILMVPLYEGQAFFNDIYSYLARFGYSLFDIYNVEYAENRQAKWADALFLSPLMRYEKNGHLNRK